MRGSNAVQWQMIRDALAAGAHVYDLRGITDTLDSDDSHVGLIQFKVGTGGEAVEYAGEWDLPAQPGDLRGLRPVHEAAGLRRVALTLYVDGDRWRTHLKDVLARHPGLVPVAKGNGYGFGLGRLARKAEWLGVDTLAVGTYEELPHVMQRYDGSLLVLTPWRPFSRRAARPAGDPHGRPPRGPGGAGRPGPLLGTATSGRPGADDLDAAPRLHRPGPA